MHPVMRNHRGRLCLRRSALCIPALGLEHVFGIRSGYRRGSSNIPGVHFAHILLRFQTPCPLFDCAGRFAVLLAADNRRRNITSNSSAMHPHRSRR